MINELMGQIEELETKVEIAKFNRRPFAAIEKKIASLQNKLDKALEDHDLDD